MIEHLFRTRGKAEDLRSCHVFGLQVLGNAADHVAERRRPDEGSHPHFDSGIGHFHALDYILHAFWQKRNLGPQHAVDWMQADDVHPLARALLEELVEIALHPTRGEAADQNGGVRVGLPDRCVRDLQQAQIFRQRDADVFRGFCRLVPDLPVIDLAAVPARGFVDVVVPGLQVDGILIRISLPESVLLKKDPSG